LFNNSSDDDKIIREEHKDLKDNGINSKIKDKVLKIPIPKKNKFATNRTLNRFFCFREDGDDI